MPVKPIPDGFHTVTPCLSVKDAAKLRDFLKAAFQAEVRECHRSEDGTVAHAEARIGDSFVMVGEAMPGCPPTGPAALYLYVNDADAVWRQAVAAGATSVMEPADQFYGDRNGGVKDAWGNQWWIGTHVEDVPPDELERRAKEWERKARQKK